MPEGRLGDRCDPGRFQGGPRAIGRYWAASDIHDQVADRLSREADGPVLDLGCGHGNLMRPLNRRGTVAVGLDRSPSMLAAGFGPRLLGDALHLPFRGSSFGGVAALYMLYHLADSKRAIAESHRVLRQGGLFVAATPSRDDDPQLQSVLPAAPPMTFDAESGPGLVRELFEDVEVERWDAPLVHLPDSAALALYLYHHSMLPRDQAQRAAMNVSTPLTLTKRGALIWGYKRPH